ncbi:carbonic anhydrase [Oscillatoriales cyanobacterium USR001]|nr:carbonic anhydrase [Oscillatoriales cyanobacterium USR001]
MVEVPNLGKMSRRKLILLSGASAIAASLTPQLLKSPMAIAETNPQAAFSNLTPDQSIKKLMDGNQRYFQHKRIFPDQSPARVTELAKGQHPFAIVLGCADSRVSPELLFDQGLGNLFDIRVAGNIINDAVLGSIEYAILELKTPLIFVLGHERCGAVTAAVNGKSLPGKIGTLVAAIKPAVDQVKNQPGDKVDNAVRANIKMSVNKLKSTSSILSEAMKSGKLKIVGGRYDLDTGKVDMIT